MRNPQSKIVPEWTFRSGTNWEFQKRMSQDQQANDTHPKHSHWFVVLVALFITCLITANIIAVKLISIFGLVVPVAIIIFQSVIS